jgi:hypothetical protein
MNALPDILLEAQQRGATLRRSGSEWIGPCPLCGGRDRFAVNTAKQIFNCRRCQRGGDAIEMVKLLDGVEFAEAVHILKRGLPKNPRFPRPRSSRRREVGEKDLTAFALRIWGDAVPLPDTDGGYYFDYRGLQITAFADLSHCLRWHEGIRAVVALMTDPKTNIPMGIHRTFLDAGARKIERKMLGRQGVIRLTPDEDVCEGLGIAEGIEDALSVLASWSPVWAATSAGAIKRFPVLSGIDALTIFADADPVGTDAATTCAERWRDAGKEAQIRMPPVRRQHQ